MLIEIACEEFDITVEQYHSLCRPDRWMLPRHAVRWMVRKKLGFSLERTAMATLGKPCHKTIWNSIERLNALVKHEPEIGRKLQAVIRRWNFKKIEARRLHSRSLSCSSPSP